ncbi:MAG: hypothetical protein ACR2J3_02570 [Aridibacter sp.]
MKQIFTLITLSVLSFAFFQAEDRTDNFLSIEKEQGSLVKRVEEAVQNQSDSNSNGFRVPVQQEQIIWKEVVKSILDKHFKQAEKILNKNKFPYKLILFTEKSNGRKYILLEEKSGKTGWGFYVFDLETKSPLAIEIPHPVSDENTELQGIEAFLQTRARAFLLAGTHRRTNEKLSVCTQATDESQYAESDVAHSVATMFHQTHETLVNKQKNTVAVQLHGMKKRDICPDVFMSSGTKHVTKNAAKLLECLKNKKIEAGIYDGKTSTCPLIASTNVQGRFSNGEKENACRKYAETSPEPGFFIHIEQEPNIRETKKNRQAVIDALKCAFPY